MVDPATKVGEIESPMSPDVDEVLEPMLKIFVLHETLGGRVGVGDGGAEGSKAFVTKPFISRAASTSGEGPQEEAKITALRAVSRRRLTFIFSIV